MKSCNTVLLNDSPSFVLSPCQFKTFGKVSENGGFENGYVHRNRHTEKLLLKTNSDTQYDLTDWSNHERIIAVLSDRSSGQQSEGTSVSSSSKNGLVVISRAWILAQLDAILSFSKEELNSMVLGNKMLLHFQVKGIEFARPHEVRKRAAESLIDIMYVMSISEDFLQSGVAYELEFSEINKVSINKKSLEFFLEKLCLGEGLTLNSVRERISNKPSNLEISSLSWMGTTAADVTNSRYFRFDISLLLIIIIRC